MAHQPHPIVYLWSYCALGRPSRWINQSTKDKALNLATSFTGCSLICASSTGRGIHFPRAFNASSYRQFTNPLYAGVDRP